MITGCCADGGQFENLKNHPNPSGHFVGTLLEEINLWKRHPPEFTSWHLQYNSSSWKTSKLKQNTKSTQSQICATEQDNLICWSCSESDRQRQSYNLAWSVVFQKTEKSVFFHGEESVWSEDRQPLVSLSPQNQKMQLHDQLLRESKALQQVDCGHSGQVTLVCHCHD